MPRTLFERAHPSRPLAFPQEEAGETPSDRRREERSLFFSFFFPFFPFLFKRKVSPTHFLESKIRMQKLRKRYVITARDLITFRRRSARARQSDRDDDVTRDLCYFRAVEVGDFFVEIGRGCDTTGHGRDHRPTEVDVRLHGPERYVERM